MKYIKTFHLIFAFTSCLIYSGCEKNDDKPADTATTTPAEIITSSTVFADNTLGYMGGTVKTATVSFFGVQGDSTGYSIEAASGSTFILIKTGSTNFPATPPTIGTYNIFNLNSMCDTCSHTLLPNEVIMLCGDVVTSGTVNVAFSGNKYVYTFTNITVANSVQPWSGKLVSP